MPAPIWFRSLAIVILWVILQGWGWGRVVEDREREGKGKYLADFRGGFEDGDSVASEEEANGCA